MLSYLLDLDERVAKQMDEIGDPRVRDWLLMRSPSLPIILTLSYIIFVKYIGPKIMEKRKPFILKNAIIVYNAISITISSYVVYKLLDLGWFRHYTLICQPIDYSNSPEAVSVARVCWIYYMSKYFEFLDTIFFVLRKKYNQISVLHVFHHSLMPLSLWYPMRMTPGGTMTFLPLLNSIVHVIMYSYYLLAALGPQYQKYLWWKKHLTALQMVQFVLIMLHGVVHTFYDNCWYPRFLIVLLLFFGIIIFSMFFNFYLKQYKKTETMINNKTKTRIH